MLAGLEPRSVLEPERNERRRRRQPPVPQPRLPLREAIHHFLEANGELPSHRRLTHFARQLHIALELRSKPWAEHLDEARAYRASLGLTTPAENPKPQGHAARKTVKVPEGGIPGAPRRVIRRGSSLYNEEDCVAALRRFDEEAPSSEPCTQKRYLEFSVEHGTVPPKHFQRYGGFTKLMQLARRKLTTES